MEKGDIVRLDRPADDKAIINADGKDRFIGKIGLKRFRKSVEVTEILIDERDEVKELLQQIEFERRSKLANTLDSNDEEVVNG